MSFYAAVRQYPFIAGRSACGGNTFHEPSPWRKKKIDSNPAGFNACTHT